MQTDVSEVHFVALHGDYKNEFSVAKLHIRQVVIN